MGKRKINTLRGKRLVTGNPNLITMNEIHVKDTQKGIEVTERDKNGKLVNVNVPQSGGSGGGESGGSTLEYIDLRNVTGAAAGSVLMVACHFKVIITVNDTEVLKSAGFSATVYEEMAGGLGGKINYIAAAIDFSQKITMNMNGQNRVATVADTCIENGATQEQLDALTRLTKEEYYNLEA